MSRGHRGGPAPTRVEALLAEAERALVERRGSSLSSIAGRLMSTPAVTGSALHRLAQLANRSGDVALAERLMRAAVQAAPGQATLHASLGDLLQATGRAAEALPAWREALRRDPGLAAVRFRLGTTLSELGDAAAAEGCFRELLVQAPAEPAFLSGLAASLLALRRVEEAIEVFEALALRVPQHAGVQTELARLHRECGRLDRARAAAQRALALDPVSSPAGVLLAEILQVEGRDADAESLCEGILERDPSNLQAMLVLSAALVGQQRSDEALDVARRALAVDATSGEAHLREAIALFDVARPLEAARACRRCLAIDPDHVGARYQLAVALLVEGDTSAAIAVLQELLDKASEHPGAWALMASARVDEGDFDDAERCARRAIELDASLADAWVTLAKLGRIADDDTRARTQLGRIAADSGASDEGRALANMALGQMLEEAARYEAAFDHYSTANRLLASRLPFDPAAHVALVDALIDVFDAPAVARIQCAAGNDSERPVFVVGMPRSGTTLVEQILASHPQVYGGGERMFFERETLAVGAAEGHAAYPRRVLDLPAAALTEMAARYLGELDAGAGDALRVTDKLPANFMHLGLIGALFPHARIVHCRRDPLDTCLSVYLQRFSMGNHYAYDCSSLALYYRQYQRLMRHWEQVLPGRLHAVSYERLVAEQEAVSRELLAAVGLGWHDDCLAFYDTRRSVRTASRWQVRKPIYTSSVGRAARFGASLAPLREAMIAAGVSGVTPDAGGPG